MPDLVLLRHGQSTWNAENLFTGWVDVDLTQAGEAEAVSGGALLGAAEDLDLRVVHTSVLTRAVRTANLALDAAGRSWIPVRRHWRLNERHYGDLQGRNKKETAEQYGAEQVKLWRRSYDTPPPPLPVGDRRHPAGDPRYRDVPADALPATECLADVVEGSSPTGTTPSCPTCSRPGPAAARCWSWPTGTRIRALRKHIDGISDAEIVALEVPTGIPFRYRLADDLSVTDAGYLGDPEAARTAAQAVARQAG